MATKKKKQRSDGFANVLTKVGDRYRDKTRAGLTFARDFVDEITAEEIWLGDDIAARVIEMPPKVQLQNGFEVQIAKLEPKDTTTRPYVERGDLLEEDDEEEAEALAVSDEDEDERAEEKAAEERLKAILDDLETVSTFIEARQWSRAYGGSAILLGIDDGARNLAEPVDEDAIKAIRFMVVLRPREIWPTKWSNNPRSGMYGKPVEYSVQRETNGNLATSTFQVHHSRIIRFDGIKVSRRHTRVNRGWGDSILNRLIEPLGDFQQSYKAVPNLIADFAQGVHKIKGLAELLLNNEDEAVTKRIESMDLARSVLRSLVIDSEDDFSRQSTPIAGLPELLDRCAKRFAASADMPVSMLMGDQPAGLNATGEQNTRWWYDAQGADRELKVRPAINRLVRLIFLSSEGPTGGKEPEQWTVEFASLWIPSDSETADLRSKVANADKAYVDAGVLTPEEVAISRFGGTKWSMETRIDLQMRKLQATQTKTAVANEEGPNSPAAAAALSSQLKAPGQPGGGPAEEGNADADKDDPVEDDGFRIKPWGTPRLSQGILIDVGSQRVGARTDYDESQPRDERGRWGSGGGVSVKGNKKDPKAAKAEVKRGAISSAAAKLGGDKKIADMLVNGWQEDSGSGDGLALKAAIALEIGVAPEEALERARLRLASQGVAGAAGNAAAANAQVAKQIEKAKDAKVRATARALAQASQAAHEGATVTVYRGVSGAQAEQIKAAIAAGASTVDLSTDAVASFTEDPKVARVFGHGGVILKMQVPREAIVLSHRASSALKKFGDSEVVVATLGKFTIARDDVTEWQPERVKTWAEIQAEIAAENKR